MKILLPLLLKKINGIGLIKARDIIESNILPKNMEEINDWLIEVLGREVLSVQNINKEELKIILEDINDLRDNSIKNNINILSILDDKYPPLLREIHDAPTLLYYKGKYECLVNRNIVAIVGTRYPTNNGKRVAVKTARYFSQLDYSIVSGLAMGCDTYVHRAVIEMKKKAVAVMPCGLDNIIPKTNIELADNILSNEGCLISEYEIGTPISKYNYINRNRIQSGISRGVIAIETPQNGGTVETMKLALKHHRLVGCYNCDEIYENILGNIQYINEKKAMGYRNLKELDNIESIIRSYDISSKQQLSFKI